MADNKIQMPGAFGGLMRYDEEYTSRFMLTPIQVIIFIVAIILLIIVLKTFFPIETSGFTNVGSAPLPTHGSFLSLIF